MIRLFMTEVENSDSGIILVDRESFTEHVDKDDPNDIGPVRLTIRVMYCDYWEKEWAKKGKYHVSVQATAPTGVREFALKSVLDSCGLTPAEYASWTTEQQAGYLTENGTAPTLWQEQGNNLSALLRAARKEIRTIKSFTFGFAMDRPQNAIGATGWDWIVGNITGK